MRCQFSGPFKPLPPETTISASAIVTLFDVFSIEDTLFLLSEMLKLKSEISVFVGFSFRPKEFFETGQNTITFSYFYSLKSLICKCVSHNN